MTTYRDEDGNVVDMKVTEDVANEYVQALTNELHYQRRALDILNLRAVNADTKTPAGQSSAALRAAVVAQTLELRRIADALEARNKR